MKLKVRPIDVPETDPFANDRLGRRKSVDAVAEILSLMDEPLVMAICSPWGTGKTTFLSMLRMALESGGFRTIFLNAWESDFADDATMSILSAVEQALEELHSRAKPKSRSSAAIKQLTQAGLALVKTAVPFGVRIASGGLLSLPADLQGPISDFLSKVAEEQLGAYKSSKQTVEDFKNKLTKALLAEGALSGEKPLVLLVDELDRCKPTYAIQFLEVVKHFFNIPRLAFVLAIDESQLNSSVESVYGQRVAAAEYLRKFVDFKYYLPQATSDEYIDSLYSRFDFARYFKQRTSQIPVFRSDLGDFHQASKWYFCIFHTSLRAQEQLLTHLSLILRSTPHDMILFPSVLLLFMIMREEDRRQYLQIMNGDRTARDIIDGLMQRSKESKGDADHLNLRYLEAMLVAVVSDGDASEKTYSEMAANAEAPKEERDRAAEVLTMLGHIHMNYRVGKSLDYFSKKIELLDPFVHRSGPTMDEST